MFYWKVEDPELFSTNNFPCVALYDGTQYPFCAMPFYAMPVCEYPGLIKVSQHNYAGVYACVYREHCILTILENIPCM